MRYSLRQSSTGGLSSFRSAINPRSLMNAAQPWYIRVDILLYRPVAAELYPCMLYS